MVWLAYRSRFLLAAKPQPGAARDCLADIRRGLPVTAATLAGALVTGAGKLTADAGWGLEAFGQVSFALSLAPLCLFDGKMQLLYSTFLKALHRQKALLWLNLIAAGISVGGCLLAAWTGWLGGIVAAVVAASAVRAMLAEWYLQRRCGLPGGGWLAVELGGTAVFYLLGALGIWTAAASWTALYLLGVCILWIQRRKNDGLIACNERGSRLFYGGLGFAARAEYALSGRHKWGHILQKNARLRELRRHDICFVVGNGPSLNQTDLSLLEGKDVITVNAMVNATPASLLDELPRVPLESLV